jgi:DNA-binding transcriptional MocR family regulator
MFVWGRFVDTTVDTTALLTTAIACGVAFVPGAAFHPRIPGVSSPRHELRLSFATLPAPVFDEAARRLAMALRSVHRDAVPAA